tara:strand:+ start:2546 stop:2803 length:258 start_codon:yes stop_codon:yes gene_type:complete
MSRFNSYAFIKDLEDLIAEESPSDVNEFIHEHIDTAVIYYKDCFEILQSLHFTDWENHEFGNVTNISQLAFIALYDFVNDTLETA